MKQKKVIFLPERKWTRIFLSLVFLMVMSTGMAFAQKSISGKVTDESGSSVPGVSVVVKGTTTGTITDADGKFSLTAPANATTLSFSFIGMISVDMPIGQNNVINVTMKSETIGVEEVVVVGYGTRLKEQLTGSVSTMSDKQLKVSTAPSVVSRMQGQISGVTITSSNTPGSEATIRIHGIG